MNLSTAIFLVDKSVRGLVCTYEDDVPNGKSADRVLFKTFDASIAVGDFVVVPTHSRHRMTVNKVVEADVDPDFDKAAHVDWIVCKIDRHAYEETLKKETIMVDAIKTAEKRKKRDELASSLMKEFGSDIQSLALPGEDSQT